MQSLEGPRPPIKTLVLPYLYKKYQQRVRMDILKEDPHFVDSSSLLAASSLLAGESVNELTAVAFC